MPAANLDLVRSILAVWERGDFTSADWARSDIEFSIPDGPSPGSWTGLAGMAAGYRDFIDVWEDPRGKAEEFRELDDERVLVLVRRSGRGRRSGVDMTEMRTQGAVLFHIRDGEVTRLLVYWDSMNALADISLRPETGS
jgi:ketosteroid isomerase-like protein